MRLLQVSSIVLLMFLATLSNAFMPYPRSVWDMMLPTTDDPFKILEQVPIPKGVETSALALARADWKETPQAHLISLDIPGIKRDDIKIEVEENRVLRISGERKVEGEVEGEKWHRAERTNGRFWRQFRLPGNADLDNIKAQLEDGVLKIKVLKFADQERKRHTKVIDIQESSASDAQDIKATKASASAV